ncbi:hypothetical protein G6F24_013196 [Rhizopus arrhizus]|nr:hypothetical protein G6F24_013196 [Rhizopus arrhizus]
MLRIKSLDSSRNISSLLNIGSTSCLSECSSNASSSRRRVDISLSALNAASIRSDAPSASTYFFKEEICTSPRASILEIAAWPTPSFRAICSWVNPTASRRLLSDRPTTLPASWSSSYTAAITCAVLGISSSMRARTLPTVDIPFKEYFPVSTCLSMPSLPFVGSHAIPDPLFLRAYQRLATSWVIAIPRLDWPSFDLPRHSLGWSARFQGRCCPSPAKARTAEKSVSPPRSRRR